MQEERLNDARGKALTKVNGAVDLFVLSVRGRAARGAAGSQNINIAVHAPVGALQIGDSNLANVMQEWTAGKQAELLGALDRIGDAIRSQQIPASVSLEGLVALLADARAEAKQAHPVARTRLKTTVSAVAAGIRTIASLAPAYATLTGLAQWLGRAAGL